MRVHNETSVFILPMPFHFREQTHFRGEIFALAVDEQCAAPRLHLVVLALVRVGVVHPHRSHTLPQRVEAFCDFSKLRFYHIRVQIAGFAVIRAHLRRVFELLTKKLLPS